jgi:hypothetical protein
LPGSISGFSVSLSLSIFREFICALDGNVIKIEIKDPNFIELEQFCEDFGFMELGVKLFDFRPSMNFTEGAAASASEATSEAASKAKTETETETEVKDMNAHGRIAAHEEKANQHSNVITKLQNEVTQLNSTQLSTHFGRFVCEVSSLQSAIYDLQSAAAGIETILEEVSALKTQIEQKLSDSVAEQLSTEFGELGKEVLIQKWQLAELSSTAISFHSISFHSIPTLPFLNHLTLQFRSDPIRQRFRSGYD